MTNSKVIAILKSFSKKEIKEFDKYIGSSYFGCRKFVVEFFRILKKYHPEFNHEDIKKEKLFGEMYKDKKYNDGLMRRINSEILKYSEEFLMLTRLYKTSAYRNNCLLMELRDRNLQSIFKQKSRLILNELEKSKEIDFYYLLDKHLTQVEIYNDLIQHNDRHTFGQLEEALSTLIIFFLNSYYSLSFNHKRLNKNHSDKVIIKFIESLDNNHFIEGLKDENSKAVVLIKLIYYSNIITIENDIEVYSKMKNIFAENYDMFSPQQKMIFYTRLFTFYLKYNLINDERFLKNQFMNYQSILEEKLFMTFGPYMRIWFGRNYINVCHLLLKYDQIQKFIINYSEFFDPESKEEFIHFCKSKYFFGKKNYGKSLEHSSKVKIELPLFKLDIKILKIMCFYELNYSESFYSEIDTLKHFLRNTEGFNKDLNTSAKNFSIFALRIMSLSALYDINKFHILKKELENEKLVTEKRWLMEKLNELVKS